MGLVVALFGCRDVSADEGFSAMLLYLVVYAIAFIGTFVALGWLADSQGVVDRVSSLAGIGFRRPAAAACVAIFMFSLAGIPPLAGFWGKFFLFWSTISLGLSASFSSTSFCFIILAVVGVLNAAIGTGLLLAYYCRHVLSGRRRGTKADPLVPLLGLCSCDVNLCNSGPGSPHWPRPPDEGNS